MGKSVDPLSMITLGASSLIGGVGNAVAADAANETNLRIARETNENLTNIARENNQAQREMLQMNNSFNAGETNKAWQRSLQMFNLENQYNSPIEQLKRYQSAGINPSVAFGGSLGSASSSAASGNVPAAASAGSSGISPTMPSLVTPSVLPVNFATGLSDGFEKAAGALLNVAKAKREGVETRKVEAMLSLELDREDLKNQALRLDNYFQKTFGNIRYSLENQKQIGEINKIHQEYFNLVSQGHLTEAAYRKTIQDINESISRMDLTKEQKRSLKLENDNFMTRFNKEMQQINQNIATGKAQENAANAAAAESRAGAGLKEEQRVGVATDNLYKPAQNAAEIAVKTADAQNKTAEAYNGPWKYGVSSAGLPEKEVQSNKNKANKQAGKAAKVWSNKRKRKR